MATRGPKKCARRAAKIEKMLQKWLPKRKISKKNKPMHIRAKKTYHKPEVGNSTWILRIFPGGFLGSFPPLHAVFLLIPYVILEMGLTFGPVIFLTCLWYGLFVVCCFFSDPKKDDLRITQSLSRDRKRPRLWRMTSWLVRGIERGLRDGVER